MTRFWIPLLILASACGAPEWPEGAEVVARERTSSEIGLIWDEVEGASGYVARLNGGDAREVTAPNTEVRFEGLDESTLYQVDVRVQNLFGESEPLTIQVRTRDATAPVFPEGAELVYELTGAARFGWPEAIDAIGVGRYELRNADTQELLDSTSELELVYDDVPPSRIALVATDYAGNVSEPLIAELTSEQMLHFAERRLEYHRELAEEFEVDQINDVPEGVDPNLLRQLVIEARREERER